MQLEVCPSTFYSLTSLHSSLTTSQNNSLHSVYPTITSGKSTKVIIISTPNGMNHFYKMWEDARRGKNDYITNERYIGHKYLAEMLNGKRRQLRHLT